MATDATGRVTRVPEAERFRRRRGRSGGLPPGPNGDVTYADILSGNVRRLVYGAGNRPPVAAFTTTSDPATRTVSFSAADSYDLDGDELSFDWDFGDGASAEGATTTHTYSDRRPVQVTLTVTDQLGARTSTRLPSIRRTTRPSSPSTSRPAPSQSGTTSS